MNCEDVARNEIAEQYVAGRLDEAGRDAYEVHFFECSECLDHLQLVQAISAGLTRQPVAVPVLVPRRQFPSYASLRWLAAAAVLVLVSGIGWWDLRRVNTPAAPVVQAQTSATAGQVAAVRPNPSLELARVEAPPYREPRMRGSDNVADEQFRAAMRHYQQHDYAAAIPGLTEAARLNPKSSAIEFFLGVSHLLNGNRREAIVDLRIVAAMEDSLEAGDAHFYLGQALLGEHDTEGAVAEFKKAIAAESEHAAEASRIIDAVRGGVQ